MNMNIANLNVDSMSERERVWLDPKRNGHTEPYLQIKRVAEITMRNPATIQHAAARGAFPRMITDGTAATSTRYVPLSDVVAWLGPDAARTYGLITPEPA